jgi:hypothetical protein
MIKEQELNREMKTLKIIWFAMLFSLAVYFYVGLAVVNNPKSSMPNESIGMPRAVFYFMACIILLITKTVRKFIFSVSGQNKRQTETFQRPEIQKYTSAMTEGIGIFGLVLYILGKNVLDLYILIAVAAVAMLQYRPNRDEVIRLFDEDRMGTGPAAGL